MFLNSILTKITWILFIITLLLSASCSSVRNIKFQEYLLNSNCNQHSTYNYTLSDIPTPIHELKLDTALLSRFSFRSLNAANSIGILGLLSEYVNSLNKYKIEPSLENKVHALELFQEIDHSISLSSLEISSVASELDCEDERIDQIADYLNKKENELESRLTVTAIGVGAIAAILSGFFLNNEGHDEIEYVGISAGVIEAILGTLILTNQKRIEFYHPRNALREIWEGNVTSTIFPPSVWYYLTYYNHDIEEHQSLRYQIIEKWMSFGQISKATSQRKKKLIELYFGDGGKYTTEQLFNRANMYDQLESHIKLMKQDLLSLSHQLGKI